VHAARLPADRAGRLWVVQRPRGRQALQTAPLQKERAGRFRPLQRPRGRVLESCYSEDCPVCVVWSVLFDLLPIFGSRVFQFADMTYRHEKVTKIKLAGTPTTTELRRFFKPRVFFVPGVSRHATRVFFDLTPMQKKSFKFDVMWPRHRHVCAFAPRARHRASAASRHSITRAATLPARV
jgi:hypothetical protein